MFPIKPAKSGSLFGFPSYFLLTSKKRSSLFAGGSTAQFPLVLGTEVHPFAKALLPSITMGLRVVESLGVYSHFCATRAPYGVLVFGVPFLLYHRFVDSISTTTLGLHKAPRDASTASTASPRSPRGRVQSAFAAAGPGARSRARARVAWGGSERGSFRRPLGV